ncbi:hypothetical protein APHAL10511_000393 [Amanita phalloides]|nr:hypothetical protein APHAL10511_000393 [Amanita phalloides]
MGSDNVELEGALSPDSSLAWTYKPAFGIIHPVSCAICRSYMTHLVVANQSCEPSFKEALSEREVRLSTAFFDGVREGRHLQQEHDIALLTRCKEERDQAMRRLEMHKQLLDVAKRELDALRDQVMTLQDAFDDLSHQKNTSSPAKSIRSTSAGSDISSMERLLLGSSVYLDYIDECSTSTPKSVDDELAPTISDHSSFGNSAVRVTDPKKLGKTSTDTDSTISISVSPVSFDLKTARSTPATSTASRLSLSATPLPPPASKPIAPAPKPFPVQHSTSVPTRTSPSPKPLTTHSHLQALMKAAHAGDDSALSRVKAFCAAAHVTPRDQRTELQRYALVHWRSRSVSDPLQPTSDGNLSVEIYVDASAWGVGFVMDEQWLAWKYADSVCLAAQSIDISWAEMLAVEVGLWTVIHWAMLQEQKQGQHLAMSVLAHSDNAGVIKAIERQYSTHPAQQEVLQRILDLISEYDIQLTMKWISSVDNLADNPSRGVPGLGATLLSYVPPVPQYLSTILVPITSFA